MLMRSAKVKDCNILSNLAYKSKAYWGYTEDFLQQCKNDLTVTKDYIEENPVYLMMESDNKIVAFYSFTINDRKLDALFIDPDFIGQGLGRIIWDHVLNKAEELGINEFTLDSEPNAEGFYLKMGAKNIGSTPSTVFPDRHLPLMKVKVF
ncbi:GNAT family N-acetyltransferase [Lysinibacillus mangiferihumi]|uniref:GNAT family N-acetyltransferase n=1 Tax=Lysinibacillus mangiferihumi TaxID=1130819 RepID=A0A4U2ZGU9_9BACI|nr:GNAT family N-acetyltransferase [Lysinibacillus mangiferihumi]TKI72671.1 GNAT family N-acetyltransferase [Lysinibacillus mangiferihumi]